ncbi:MAG TPA: TIM barrel protein [Alphaproteobacteria bacterium]|nr:TIM barrel protein [Alphaproteobacteria bacterium]
MLTSIATVSLSGTLKEKLEAISAARFDGVEIFENDLICCGESPRDVRAIASDLGLEIYLYQPFRNFEVEDDNEFRRNLERARRKLDVMADLGVRLLLVCSSVAANAAGPERAAEQLRALAELAAEHGVRIGYEALAWGRMAKSYKDAWDIVRRADHPHLGLILDSFHSLAIDDDLSEIARIPGSRIFFTQVADAPAMKLDVLSWSRHFRCFPGQGNLPVAKFVGAVVRAGYAGPLSLEVFNDDFRASPTRPTAVDGLRSLLFLEEQVCAEIAGEPRRPARPPHARPRHLRVELFDPPPAPQFAGVAFIEFAVDGPSGAALEQWLGKLGFRRAGRHRSKRVTLLRQGDVNIVLNAEQQGFARSYFLLHGPSVCAIALASDDPLLAAARAEAFKAARGIERVHSNEVAIPSIRALDACMLYFVGTAPELAPNFLADFILGETDASTGVGLREIDHVAFSLPEGLLDAWVLFLRATLGMVPDEPVDLADPYGLVRSRAMATPGRSVRFPLNIADGRRTVTAQSVSTFAGAGVHQIAIGADDMFATAARLKAAGVEVLAIPANYYDDLAAKFDLDPAFVYRLQNENILYDQDAAGAFLHLYTLPFEDRFFFEILQRTGGYAGYGALNAPVRMAAMSRWYASRHPPPILESATK